MAVCPAEEARELMRQWVETWRQAGDELAAQRRVEIESANTQEAVQHIFGSDGMTDGLPPRQTSGLVEQQAWFARLRR